MLIRLKKRKILQVIVSAVVLILFFCSVHNDVSSSWLYGKKLRLPVLTRSNLKNNFYTTLVQAIVENKPTDSSPDLSKLHGAEGCSFANNVAAHDSGHDSDLSYESLSKCYNLNKTVQESLREVHSKFTDTLSGKLNFSIPQREALFSGSEGIVTIGGGKYSVLAYTMIKKLRDTGTTLPIEVIIPPQDEGEDDFCKNWLPKFNGKCIYFSDIVPSKPLSDLKLTHFQLKVFGLIISSFKRIIFLDADNYAVKNLDLAFNTTSFNDTGLILWPDFWRRVTPPAFYNIIGSSIDIGKRVRFVSDDISPVSRYDPFVSNSNDYTPKERQEHFLKHVPLHDLDGTMPDLSSESGQMVIDKIRHFNTLLLALYYNVYGPTWYYKMISQGTAGEGDKDTFVAAAHALNMPYYQVRTKFEFDGFFYQKDDYKGLALLQHDFEQDYKQYQKAQQKVKANIEEFSKLDPDYTLDNGFLKTLMVNDDGSDLDIMFIHASFYKADPWTLYHENRFIGPNGEQVRGFRKPHRYGMDFELFLFNDMSKSFCTTPKSQVIKFKYFTDKVNTPEWDAMCEYLTNHVNYLESTHKEAMGEKN
ncbi:AQG_2a_G0028450.mRNA.1.CDS.1 [Saccharomyces cerevisiae]|uniref:Mnn5p n=4 Tax=Saccharomyces TaxID=4930 RepID=H0GIH0_SACCK